MKDFTSLIKKAENNTLSEEDGQEISATMASAIVECYGLDYTQFSPEKIKDSPEKLCAFVIAVGATMEAADGEKYLSESQTNVLINLCSEVMELCKKKKAA